MSEQIDHLKSLHTVLIDSRNGYEEAIEDAGAKGLVALFREMQARREHNAREIKNHLVAMGEKVDENGSFLTTVHRAVISIRSLFGDLDENILAGLIDGEKRILSYYDEAIEHFERDTPVYSSLATQRISLAKKVADLELWRDMAA